MNKEHKARSNKLYPFRTVLIAFVAGLTLAGLSLSDRLVQAQEKSTAQYAAASAPDTRANSISGMLDWRSYLVQMETNNWDYFGKIDGRAFKTQFWPRLQIQEFDQNPEFLLVCGSGFVNWAFRQRALSPQEKDQCYRESLPLLLKASELGSWLAMTETSWMYRIGLGTRQDFAEAVRWASNAVAVCEHQFGSEHRNTCRALISWSDALSTAGQRARALSPREQEPLLQRILKFQQQTLAPEHPDIARTLNELGALYFKMRDYTKAEPLLQRALEIREHVRGPEHTETALTLNNLAALFVATGRYAQAEPLYTRALSIREKVRGREHLETAMTLHGLAVVYEHNRNDAKAEALYQRALNIREKVEPEHPNTATTLHNLAALYVKTGRYPEADSLYQRALRIREKVAPERPETALTLHNLAGLYQNIGEYSKAEPLYQRALKIREKVLGPEHRDTAQSLNNLAVLYSNLADYAKAEPLYQRALNIREKVLGSEHRDTAQSLNNLAVLYSNLADYAKAELFYQRALKIQEKVLGPEHRVTAITLNNLAGLYQRMGDYAKAEQIYQRALKIREKVLGPEHRDTAASLNTLATLYNRKRDYAKAETFLQRALKIREKVLGPQHRDTAQSLSSLATLYRRMGNYAKAEPLCQQALKIYEKALGPEHPATAGSLKSLAMISRRRGNYAKAEALLQRALKIEEKAFGLEHPDTATTLEMLSFLFLDLNQPAQAREFFTQAQAAELKTLANVLSFTSEQQRLAYQATCNPYSGFASLGDGPSIALAILRHKGIVLDSVLEDRLLAQANRNPEDRTLLDQLKSAKQQLTQLWLELPADRRPESLPQRAAERAKLTQEIEQMEATLARRVAGLGRTRRALGVTVAQVQKALPRNAALIELLHYKHYLGRNKFEGRIGAAVIPASGQPQWVSLGGDTMETNIVSYLRLVRNGAADGALSTLLRAMHQQLWAPLEAVLPRGTTTVIISPDESLNFVSFATLLTPDDKFLGQKYALRYVASGRDLLRERPNSRTSQMLIYANPDFEAAGLKAGPELPEAILAMRSLKQRDWSGLQLPALPGTAKEGAALAALAQQWQWPARVYSQAEASEAQLRLVDSPRVLHLATHGFFLPFDEGWFSEELDQPRGVGGIKSLEETSWASEPSQSPVFFDNPMYWSGLALAGAQATLAAWQRGETPPSHNDGIITAAEVGDLNLQGTWLVTLAACETGIGAGPAWESVGGLRRGFIQAGAQNLLMTLWSVADKETTQLMVDFYEAAHKSGDAGQALADVQRDWLVKLRQEHGLEAAVRLAGPFILSSQGSN